MSAPPSFRQFQEARDRIDHPAGKDAPDDMPSHGAWREVGPDAPDGEQGAWSYVRRHEKPGEASETERYPRTIRLGLIGALSLSSWALLLGAGRILAAALK
jgi:hypothetical protein